VQETAAIVGPSSASVLERMETMSPQPRVASPEDREPRRAGGSSPTFPSERRIRKRREFSSVFDRGQRIHGRFFTFLLLQTPRDRSRLGIVASRKIGGAVQRNRAKRLIREMFRTEVRLSASASAIDLVVIPRRELLDAEFSAALQDFRNTLRRGLDRLASSRG
jgi:ribonuclease P protein component